jgi:hypothetical protein
VDDESGAGAIQGTLCAVSRPRPLRPSSLTGPVTTAQAAVLGLQPWQLRMVGLVPVVRGVWLPDEQAGTLEGRAAAVLHVMPKGSVLSHLTAARLRGLPLPDAAADEPVHVLVPKPAHPRIAGVRAHLVQGLPAYDLHGDLPVSPAARNWVDLAGTLDRLTAVQLGDSILFRKLSTPEEFETELRIRRPVIRRARELYPLLDARSASPMESEVRLLLIDEGLLGFVVNVAVTDEDGGWICEPDIAWLRPLKVAIQYQGDHHRTDRKQWQRDISGEDLMREHGWILIRLVAYDLKPYRKAITAQRIRSALESRGYRPPHS